MFIKFLIKEYVVESLYLQIVVVILKLEFFTPSTLVYEVNVTTQQTFLVHWLTLLPPTLYVLCGLPLLVCVCVCVF